jgi:hypothetical protein
MSFQNDAFQVPGFQTDIIAGSGQSKTSPVWVPQPAYEVKKQKPFRPIWDKPRQGEIEHPRALGAIPLPPAGIFTPGAPPAELFATKGLDPAALNLPRFDHLVPGDVDGLSHRLRNAMDSGDAEAALRAFAEQQQPAPRPPQGTAPAPVARPVARSAPPRSMVPPPPIGAPSAQDIADAMATLAEAGFLH